MTDIAYAQVWADHVVSVGEPGETVTVTVLSGDTVYYGDPAVTATSNLGSLTVGQSTSLTNPATWLRSASQSYVQITGQTASSGVSGASVISLSGDVTGATDQAAIQAAINAGGVVRLGAIGGGQAYVTGLTMRPGVILDLNGCTLTLANGANADVIQGQNFGALTGTGAGTTTTGVYNCAVVNGIIDGNRANQTFPGGIVNAHATPTTAPTYGYGIRWYGRSWKIRDVEVRNCLAYGLWTEFGIPSGNYAGVNSVEAYASNVKVYSNGIHGWYHRGPSDCRFDTVVCFSNNQAALSSGIDLWAENDGVTNASGTGNFSANGLQLTSCHVWGSSTTWNMVLDTNCSATNCHSEGGSVGQLLARGQLKWTGGAPYYIASQSSSWGCGVQLGDTGSTTGVPTTAAYTANVTFLGEVNGVLGDAAARAGFVFAQYNQSKIVSLVRTKTAPTATVAVGSNGVNVNTFVGAQTLFVTNSGGLPTGGGTVTVTTTGGTATITYTGITGGTQLTGCTSTGGTNGTLSTGSTVTLANVGTVATTGTMDVTSDHDISVAGSGLTSQITRTSSRRSRADGENGYVGSVMHQLAAMNMDPSVALNTSQLSASTHFVFKLRAAYSKAVTKAAFYVTPAGAGCANFYVALFDYTGTLIAGSGSPADQAALFNSAGTVVPAFGTTINVIAGQIYHLSFFHGTATTIPTVARGSSSGVANFNLGSGVPAGDGGERWGTGGNAWTGPGTPPATLGNIGSQAIAVLAGIG